MTDIEEKALALVNEVHPYTYWNDIRGVGQQPLTKALCRAIEQHEAFRQEVSDAVKNLPAHIQQNFRLSRFIIAKPDPLVDAVGECDDGTWETKAEYAQLLRAAIAKRGGKIVWGEG